MNAVRQPASVDRPADVREAVGRWIDGWARGWATHDVDLIASLYADDAVHVSAFFREPQRTADYAAWAFSDEQGAEVWFAEPVVEGNRAAVAWWAISRGVDGRETTLAGVSTVLFGRDGLVVQQRDYWNAAEDTAAAPPDDWGPIAAHEQSAPSSSRSASPGLFLLRGWNTKGSGPPRAASRAEQKREDVPATSDVQRIRRQAPARARPDVAVSYPKGARQLPGEAS
jgi:ketosteroid isomerase-like protein